MAISFDKALGIHQPALRIHEQRTNVIANNIANADTPGYKAMDIDFKAALSEAGVESRLAMARTTEAHLSVQPNATGETSGGLKYRMPYQPSMDGNTVEGHIEQAAFSDSSMRYQATLQFLGGRFASMKSILQGGR